IRLTVSLLSRSWAPFRCRAADAFDLRRGRRQVQFRAGRGFLLSGFRPICGLFFSSVTAFIREFHESSALGLTREVIGQSGNPTKGLTRLRGSELLSGSCGFPAIFARIHAVASNTGESQPCLQGSVSLP